MVEQQNLFGFAEMPEWERAAQEDVQVAQIVFNLPLERPYTYLVPESLRGSLHAGQRVKAALGRGNRSEIGYCVGIEQKNPDDLRKLKPILELIDREPLLDQRMLELTRWIGERYLCGWGQVLESVIPAGVRRRSGTRLVQSYKPTVGAASRLESLKLTRQQQEVMNLLLAANGPLAATEICERVQCGPLPSPLSERKG